MMANDDKNDSNDTNNNDDDNNMNDNNSNNDDTTFALYLLALAKLLKGLPVRTCEIPKIHAKYLRMRIAIWYQKSPVT